MNGEQGVMKTNAAASQQQQQQLSVQRSCVDACAQTVDEREVVGSRKRQNGECREGCACCVCFVWPVLCAQC